MKRMADRNQPGGAPMLAALALVVLAAATQPAYANTITVNDLGDNQMTGDGHCTLREAINNADNKSDTTGGDCAPGTGADTIGFNLAPGAVIGLAQSLTINSKIKVTVVGLAGEAGNLTISGGGVTRVFSVDAKASLTLKDLTVSSGEGGVDGGAIDNSGKLTVTNCTFSSNNAFWGGAIFNESTGKLSVTGSTFMNNSATSVGSAGGGAIVNLGKLTVTGSTFSQNSTSSGVATADGGAIYNGLFCGSGTKTCPMKVSNSTFSSNSATTYGGAIFNQGSINTGGTLLVTGSTFSDSGNSAAIVAWGKLKVSSSTFANNPGGAINSCNPAQHAKCISILKNTLLGNNGGGSCQSIPIDGGHNLEDGTSCKFKGVSCGGTKGTSLCNAAPNLDPAGLADNGGPTQTIAPCTGAGAPAGCSAASPAIGAAKCSKTDQRGYVRSGPCTIGAFEVNSPPCPSCCPSKLNACGAMNICTNLKKDPANCGSCGNVCAVGQKCSSGSCK